MSPSIRKLIGAILIVVLVIVYALVATTIAATKLADSEWYIHLAYFFFTGLLWVLPAMWLISWMSKGKKKPDPNGH
ncbi:MAG: hypothetical protein COB78_09560 [Hyphomicrobiales bacterium]|nr:MAG: hypothetical protein COB78_09560 [Hyphomicrobiales bacterium]